MPRPSKHAVSDDDYSASEGIQYEDNNTEHKRKRTWNGGFHEIEHIELPALSARAVVGPGGVFKTAAIEVLKQEKRLMATGEVTKIALERKLLVCQGKTPDATMASALYTDVRKKGGSSPFIKPKQGLFGLRIWLSEPWLRDWLSKEGIKLADFLPEDGTPTAGISDTPNGTSHAAPNGGSAAGGSSSSSRKVMKKAGGGRGGRGGGSSTGRGGSSLDRGGSSLDRGSGGTHVVVQGARSNAQRVPRVNYKPAFGDSDAEDDEWQWHEDVEDGSHGQDGAHRRNGQASASRHNGQSTAPHHQSHAAGNGHEAAAQPQGRQGAAYGQQQHMLASNGRPGSSTSGRYHDMQQYSSGSGRSGGPSSAAGASSYEHMQQYQQSRPAGNVSTYGNAMQQYVQLQGSVGHDGHAGRIHQAAVHSAHHATTQALQAAEDASASILTSSGSQQQRQQQQQQQWQQLQPVLSLQQRGGSMAHGRPGNAVTTGAAPGDIGGPDAMGSTAGRGMYGSYSNGAGPYGNGTMGLPSISSGAMGALAALSIAMPASTAAALMSPMALSGSYPGSMQQHGPMAGGGFGTGPLQNMALMELLRRAARDRGAAGNGAAYGQAAGGMGQGSVNPGGYAAPVAVGGGNGGGGGGYGVGGMGPVMAPGGGMVTATGPVQTPQQAYYQQQYRQ